MKETFEEFKEKILKKRSKRQGKVSGSYGVYDAYKSIRMNKWYDIGRPLTEHEFYTIIRSINLLLADELSKGNEIVFPYRMGSLELRKSRREAKRRYLRFLKVLFQGSILLTSIRVSI